MMRPLLLFLLLPALCLAQTLPAADDAAELRRARADFLAAERALRNGDLSRYQALLDELRDYPLYPYLRYQYLRPRLGEVADDEAAEFIRRYGDGPLGVRLREAWLDLLARHGRWQTLLRHYPADTGDAELDCQRHWALYQTGDKDLFFQTTGNTYMNFLKPPDPVAVDWEVAEDESFRRIVRRGRVLAREHPLLLATLRLAVAGRIEERDGRAWLDGHPLFKPLRLSSAGDFNEPTRQP